MPFELPIVQPLRSQNLDNHRMHSEWFEVGVDTVAASRRAGGRIVAAGTTTLRALESALRDGALAAVSGETELFIRPGYGFGVVDRLITNFRLPHSTR